MGIALFCAGALVESLQGVMGWLAPRHQAPSAPQQASEAWQQRVNRTGGRAMPPQAPIYIGHGTTAAHVTAHTPAPALPCATALRPLARAGCLPRPIRSPSQARALRVVRVLDTPSSSSAGRMVISGRMADVCAELDRLAALEASISLAA